jgi:hypothetical protein
MRNREREREREREKKERKREREGSVLRGHCRDSLFTHISGHEKFDFRTSKHLCVDEHHRQPICIILKNKGKQH